MKASPLAASTKRDRSDIDHSSRFPLTTMRRTFLFLSRALYSSSPMIPLGFPSFSKSTAALSMKASFGREVAKAAQFFIPTRLFISTPSMCDSSSEIKGKESRRRTQHSAASKPSCSHGIKNHLRPSIQSPRELIQNSAASKTSKIAAERKSSGNCSVATLGKIGSKAFFGATPLEQTSLGKNA